MRGFAEAAQEGATAIPQHFMERDRQRGMQQALSEEDEAIERLTGLDPRGLSPDLKKEFFKEQSKLLGKPVGDPEKAASFKQGLQTVQEMRNLMETGDIGKLAALKVPFSSEARQHRQQFETLGTSLIGLYGATLPTGIRNKTEFEEYMKGIARPGMTEAAIQGSLDALEMLFKTGMARQQAGPLGEVPREIMEAEAQAVEQLRESVPPKRRRTLEEILR
jgi:hypothetical protein